MEQNKNRNPWRKLKSLGTCKSCWRSRSVYCCWSCKLNLISLTFVIGSNLRHDRKRHDKFKENHLSRHHVFHRFPGVYAQIAQTSTQTRIRVGTLQYASGVLHVGKDLLEILWADSIKIVPNSGSLCLETHRSICNSVWNIAQTRSK